MIDPNAPKTGSMELLAQLWPGAALVVFVVFAAATHLREGPDPSMAAASFNEAAVHLHRVFEWNPELYDSHQKTLARAGDIVSGVDAHPSPDTWVQGAELLHELRGGVIDAGADGRIALRSPPGDPAFRPYDASFARAARQLADLEAAYPQALKLLHRAQLAALAGRAADARTSEELNALVPHLHLARVRLVAAIGLPVLALTALAAWGGPRALAWMRRPREDSSDAIVLTTIEDGERHLVPLPEPPQLDYGKLPTEYRSPWDEEAVHPVQVLSPLEEDLLRLLAGAPGHPASLDHQHGAEEDLLLHSLRERQIALEHRRTDPKFEDLPEALVAAGAIATDIGKLLAYAKTSTGTYQPTGWLHSRAGAYLLQSRASFRALPEDERTALLYAVKYHHDPRELPEALPRRTLLLIELLKTADQAATEGARTRLSSLAAAPDTDLREALRQAIHASAPRLNINGHLDPREPGGQLIGDTCFVLESHLRKVVFGALPDEVSQHFHASIRRQGGATHPGLAPLLEELRHLGWLRDHVDALGHAELWDVKVAIKTWSACILLDPSKIPPDAKRKWGASSYTDIRILRVHGQKAPSPAAKDRATVPPPDPKAAPPPPVPAPTPVEPAPLPPPPEPTPAALPPAPPRVEPPPLPPPPAPSPVATLRPLPPPPAAMVADADGPRASDPDEDDPPEPSPRPATPSDDPIERATALYLETHPGELRAARTTFLCRALRTALAADHPDRLPPGEIPHEHVPSLVNQLSQDLGRDAEDLVHELINQGARAYLEAPDEEIAA